MADKSSLMKIVFFGTTDFAVASLDALVQAGHDVAAVVTNIDKLGGRGRKEVIESAVSKYASQKGLNVLKPKTLKGPKFLAKLKSLEADLFVVIAFRMLPEQVWAMPPKGTVNVHGSLLPAYRGAAPINWAIIRGEKLTGVSIFFLDKSIDTGNVILRKTVQIRDDDNMGSLYEKMKPLGGEALLEALAMISSGNYVPEKQDESKVSAAPKLDKTNTHINFSMPALDIINLCRGLDPSPGAWFTWDGITIKLWKARQSDDILASGEWKSDFKTTLTIGCSIGSISILEMQPEGKKRMSIKEYLNGAGNKLRNMDVNGQKYIKN